MTAERQALLGALDRHGRAPLSALVAYEAPWRAFAVPGVSTNPGAIVPWLEAPRAAVAWADPLCKPGEELVALDAFARAMRAQRRGVCAIAVSPELARASLGAGFSVFKIGEEPRFDLASWARPRGNKGKKLRWAVNHARSEGVTVEEYRVAEGRDDALDADVARVVEGWRSTLARPEPQSFMRTAPLEAAERKRLFLARRGGVAEALLACSRLPGADAWYLEDVVRAPGSVNGATELLVVEALACFKAEGAQTASFALAPMRHVEQQIDRRARVLGGILSVAIRGFDRRYGFRAIARYEERFEPSEWVPRYIAFKPALPRPAVIRAAVGYLAA